MPPTRTSAAAVTSLICGLLGCFVVTGIIAIITGIIGLRATRDPNVRGRGLAIAGLVLGVLFGLGGAGCLTMSGAGLFFAKREIAQVATVVDNAVSAAAANDDARFRSYWSPTAVPPNDFVATVQAWGAPGKFEWTYNGVNVQNVNATTTIEVHGTIHFANQGDRKFAAHAVKTGNSNYQLTALYPE